jgi:hypothetical protein
VLFFVCLPPRPRHRRHWCQRRAGRRNDGLCAKAGLDKIKDRMT